MPSTIEMPVSHIFHSALYKKASHVAQAAVINVAWFYWHDAKCRYMLSEQEIVRIAALHPEQWRREKEAINSILAEVLPVTRAAWQKREARASKARKSVANARNSKARKRLEAKPVANSAAHFPSFSDTPAVSDTYSSSIGFSRVQSLPRRILTNIGTFSD